MYYVELLGTAVFAITGVLAVRRRGLDVIGALVFGLVTALGGGTVRDLMIRHPIFWFEDFDYVWAALVGALIAFSLTALVTNAYRSLLYLDAFGAAMSAEPQKGLTPLEELARISAQDMPEGPPDLEVSVGYDEPVAADADVGKPPVHQALPSRCAASSANPAPDSACVTNFGCRPAKRRTLATPTEFSK